MQEEWRNRLEQKEADNSRAEQVWRDRLRALESALATAEGRQTEWAAERARWAEEKANIWAEAKEKEVNCSFFEIFIIRPHLLLDI